MRILKSYFMRNRKIVALLCAVLCVVAAILFQKLGNEYRKRYYRELKEEILLQVDREDYSIEGCSFSKNMIDGLTVKVSERAVQKDDFLFNCYQIKETVERVAHKYPEYFTLSCNQEFSIYIEEEYDIRIIFENKDFLDDTYDSEENAEYYDCLCGIYLVIPDKNIKRIELFDDFRFVHIYGKLNGFYQEVSKLLKFEKLEHVVVIGLTDREEWELARQFEKKGIWFES